MDETRYLKLLTVLVALGIVLTLAHLCYAVYAYERSSIIQFIARELW